MSELLADAFTQSDHAINITDPNGLLVSVNDAYLRLYKFASADQVVGKTQRIIRSPLTPDSLYKEMWQTISSGAVWRGQLTNRAQDGSDVYVHLTISPIRREGRIVGYMGFSIDRAQQVMMEQQLFHANKLVVLGTLGAGLAHELNNPLASILLDAEYLQEVHSAPGSRVDHASALAAANSVIRGAERMRRVLEHLLLYSKNDGSSAHSALSVRQLLDDSFLFIERQLMSRGIDIRLDVQGDPYVNANRTQLESVVHNLLSNSRDAFAASPSGDKRISITARYLAAENVAVIDYQDNAGGIPRDILGRIFEPFFTTKGADGTGLGLAISRKIVADHGGEIGCESSGGETRFHLRLPAFLMRDAETPAAAPEADRSQGQDVSGRAGDGNRPPRKAKPGSARS